MSKEKLLPIETLLDHPQVRKITDPASDEARRRRNYRPRACRVFDAPFTRLQESPGYRFEIDPSAAAQLSRIIGNRVEKVVAVEKPAPEVSDRYRRRRCIGVVFSGGPAPGGHNVIAGIYDAAKRANPSSAVYGFLLGPDGVIENEAVELTGDIVDRFRNRGGFGMIKTGRTKIDSDEKMSLSRKACRALGLDALVVIGGDDSNTNAAFLAQEMFDDGIQVIGVPKTIDGDIQVRDAEGRVLCAMSFGFHSAARGFATGVGNLCTDAASDVKYWHICKVMGRVASHLALEVALQTHANMTLIGEDLADYLDEDRLAAARKAGSVDYSAYGMTLRHLSRVISRGIMRRAAAGKNYGVIVIPEGVLEFVNEIQTFILKLNTIIADYNRTHDTDFHGDFPRLGDRLEFLHRLARDFRGSIARPIWSERDDELFADIPAFFQEGLLTERDSHGNFQFSKVETEKVIVGLVQDYLDMMKERGEYKIGIDRGYFRKTLAAAGLDPERLGPLMFRNHAAAGPQAPLMVRADIISLKTLQQALTAGGALGSGDALPGALKKIFSKSVPSFKTQIHFYGYDGRGSDPTWFDCTYTYNLGLTAFSLIANGATGQMAAIRNLEFDCERWEPLGIPIAPLMHLEERKGKLALVLERSIVDTDSTAFRVAKVCREDWLAAHPGADAYRQPGPIRLTEEDDEARPMTLTLNALGREPDAE